MITVLCDSVDVWQLVWCHGLLGGRFVTRLV